MNGLLTHCILLLLSLMVTSAADKIEKGEVDHESLQRLEHQVANLTTRLQQLEEVTDAAEDKTNSRVLQLEQQVANLTTRLRMVEEKCDSVIVALSGQPQPEQSPIHNLNSIPLKSCKRILDEDDNAPSGLYRISPCGLEFTVYCDMESSGGGWTVIQQRVDNSTDFYRNWDDYRKGFGNLESNVWLGLDKTHCLTRTEHCELLVTMSSFSGESANSKYDHFRVGNKDSDYKLYVRGYNYTASTGGDALEVHDGHKFTTQDQDNDMIEGENCAIKYHGAWWYNKCFESNLNGRYYYKGMTEISDGIVWRTFTGYMYSVKSVTMAIRCTT